MGKKQSDDMAARHDVHEDVEHSTRRLRGAVREAFGVTNAIDGYHVTRP